MKRCNLNKECFALQCSIDQGGVISAILKRCLKATKEFEFFRSAGSLFHSVGPVQTIEKEELNVYASIMASIVRRRSGKVRVYIRIFFKHEAILVWRGLGNKLLLKLNMNSRI